MSNEITHQELQNALQIERSKWEEPHQVSEAPDCQSQIEIENDLDVPEVVSSPAAINNGWCQVFCERVYARLGQPQNLSVVSDGDTHTWLEFNGECYDAQCVSGVSHPSLLPVYSKDI